MENWYAGCYIFDGVAINVVTQVRNNLMTSWSAHHVLTTLINELRAAGWDVYEETLTKWSTEPIVVEAFCSAGITLEDSVE